MTKILEWSAGIGTAIPVYLLGQGSPYGPWSGLAVQCIWFAYIYRVRAWGLLPAAVVLTVVYISQLVGRV